MPFTFLPAYNETAGEISANSGKGESQFMATFSNRATLSYSGGTVNSNIASGEIIEVLSASKTAVVDVYSQGSEITYAINIVNSGTSAFTGLTLTDNLGA